MFEKSCQMRLCVVLAALLTVGGLGYFFYSNLKSIDCELSKEWYETTSCSKLCGNGVKTVAKTILQHPKSGGKSCPHPKNLQKEIHCKISECPVDCKISEEWTNLTSCSKSCGVGVKILVKTITQQPKFGGKSCPNSEYLQKQVECKITECPIYCEVSDWSPWSNCGQLSIERIQTRHRNVTAGPINGETPCANETRLLEERQCKDFDRKNQTTECIGVLCPYTNDKNCNETLCLPQPMQVIGIVLCSFFVMVAAVFFLTSWACGKSKSNTKYYKIEFSA